MSERGWLIERRNPAPHWIYPQYDGIWAWTTDSLAALRFARRQDAEAFIRINDIDDAESITEHEWGIGENLPNSHACAGVRAIEEQVKAAYDAEIRKAFDIASYDETPTLELMANFKNNYDNWVDRARLTEVEIEAIERRVLERCRDEAAKNLYNCCADTSAEALRNVFNEWLVAINNQSTER